MLLSLILAKMADDEHMESTDSGHSIIIATVAMLLVPLVFMLKKLLFPNFDPREPPVLRPKLPVFGHIVSLVRESGSFYARL